MCHKHEQTSGTCPEQSVSEIELKLLKVSDQRTAEPTDGFINYRNSFTAENIFIGLHSLVLFPPSSSPLFRPHWGIMFKIDDVSIKKAFQIRFN